PTSSEQCTCGHLQTSEPPWNNHNVAYADMQSYTFRKHTIRAVDKNHLPIAKVLPQGNPNAPRTSIRRVLASAMVLSFVRLDNPVLPISPDAIILYCHLDRFPVAHLMADSDLCPPVRVIIVAHSRIQRIRTCPFV
ncbi:hypothetical protein PIB30_093558, partial [Stylosanthes scabra]|nr:hypothetical protein [Stylosanthes scabra]